MIEATRFPSPGPADVGADSGAYFVVDGPSRFRPTEHVGGGWNPDEQHIAPAIGLLTHVIEGDRDQRRDDNPQLARLSCDILGVLTLEPFTIEVTVLRPGRTIELVEARLVQHGRTGVIARAWLAQPFDTGSFAGSPLTHIASERELQEWDFTSLWPGGFVRSLTSRRMNAAPGRAIAWLSTDIDLLAGEQASPTARALTVVDAANGISPRAATSAIAFPNLDLTAHIFRTPEGGSTGLDTTVSFGATGLGLTHTVLHDRRGPFGTVAQTLTVRPQ